MTVNVEPQAARGLELAEHHVEAAVAGEAHHRAAGRGQRGAHRARQAVADRGEAAVGHEGAAGLLGVEQQPAPMRSEAAVGDQDAVRRQRRLISPSCSRAMVTGASSDVKRGRDARRAIRPCAARPRRRSRLARADRAPIAASASQVLDARARVAPERDIAASSVRPNLLGHDVEMDDAACRAAARCSAWSRSRRACSRPRG